MKNDNGITKITAEYDNGEVREITKGFLCTMTPSEAGTTFSFDMVNISGAEMKDIVFGVLSLGQRMGMFYGLVESEDNDE